MNKSSRLSPKTILDINDFKRFNEKCIFQWQDRWQIIESKVKLANNNIVTWAYIHEVDYVVAVPVDESGVVYMKQEYRVSRDEIVLELPSGKVEKSATINLESEVNRELQEEVGMKALELHKLTSFYPWNYADFKIHIFLATHLVPSKLQADENEIIEVVKFPLDSLLAKSDSYAFNAQTLLGLVLAKNYININPINT